MQLIYLVILFDSIVTDLVSDRDKLIIKKVFGIPQRNVIY